MSKLLVEAIYFIPDKIIAQKQFSAECIFKEILDFFTFEIYPKYHSKIILKKNYYYKQYKINETTKLKDLLNFEDFPENTTPKIYIKLNDLMSKESDEFYTFVLKPKINPFGFMVYTVKTNTIMQESLQRQLIKLYNFDKYHPDMSAYCNSLDTLFISGGMKPNKDPISDFWIVNYNYSIRYKKYNFIINHSKMLYEKKQHSMIFNKKDNSVYIIGGSDKICMKYNIEEKYFSQLPDTNGVYIKPALIIKNDILYIFDTFDKKKLFFEKLDLNHLNKKKIAWEKFYPKNYEKYTSQYYGVCDMDLEDKIILLGGERVDMNTITYEIKNNKLENGPGRNSYAKLNDKTFYKINKNFYVAIPEFRVKESWLIGIDDITKDVSKIYFDEEGTTIFNFDSIDECDISLQPITEDETKPKDKNIVRSCSKIFIDDVIEDNKDENDEKEENIVLKTVNKNIDLSEIKNNYNTDNNSSDLKKLQSMEINFQQEIKDDKDSDNIYILREPADSKIKQKKEEENNSLNNNIENKKITVNLNFKDLGKKPKKINIKLSQFQTNNTPSEKDDLKKPKKTILYNIHTNRYLNYEGNDSNDKKYNNYKLFDMTPNYKIKKMSLSSRSTSIKNPLLKSRKIKKEYIDGHEYSFISDKIIDRNNLNLYNSFKIQKSYDFEALYGNHKILISKYLNEENDFQNTIDIELNNQIIRNKNSGGVDGNKNIGNKNLGKLDDMKKNLKNIDNNISHGKEKKNEVENIQNNDNEKIEEKNENDDKEKTCNIINNLNI